MKKTILAISALTAAAAVSAADFVSVDVERVTDDSTGVVSRAQYVRVGKDAAGLNLGLQVRTAVFDGGGMSNSLEGTVGKQFGAINLYGGLGHDNGLNGGRSFQYSLVGATAGMQLGPTQAYAGIKTRLNWESANPKQTIASVGVNVPLTTDVSLNLGVNRSYQDIKETSWGAGLRVEF